MFEFIVIHKYCGYTKIISGNDIYSALKNNGLDYKIWKEVK